MVSLSTLRSALISCGDDDERTAKNFDRMLRETGYKGKEEVGCYCITARHEIIPENFKFYNDCSFRIGRVQVDAYGFAEKLLGLVEIEK